MFFVCKCLLAIVVRFRENVSDTSVMLETVAANMIRNDIEQCHFLNVYNFLNSKIKVR